jgi:hypothetical protein
MIHAILERRNPRHKTGGRYVFGGHQDQLSFPAKVSQWMTAGKYFPGPGSAARQYAETTAIRSFRVLRSGVTESGK